VNLWVFVCAEPEAPKEKKTEADADSASSRAGKAIAGAAVTGLYTGLKFTGLAVRVASGLAASIGKDAEKALSRAEAGQGAGALARVSHVPARLALRCHEYSAKVVCMSTDICCVDCLLRTVP
jgi:hypothetical protein